MVVACGHGSVLLWQRCDMLYTCGFTDDVMFSYHGGNKPESSTTLCLEEVRQLQCLVEFVRVRHRGEVCYLWLHCYTRNDRVAFLEHGVSAACEKADIKRLRITAALRARRKASRSRRKCCLEKKRWFCSVISSLRHRGPLKARPHQRLTEAKSRKQQIEATIDNLMLCVWLDAFDRSTAINLMLVCMGL